MAQWRRTLEELGLDPQHLHNKINHDRTHFCNPSTVGGEDKMTPGLAGC